MTQTSSSSSSLQSCSVYCGEKSSRDLRDNIDEIEGFGRVPGSVLIVLERVHRHVAMKMRIAAGRGPIVVVEQHAAQIGLLGELERSLDQIARFGTIWSL